MKPLPRFAKTRERLLLPAVVLAGTLGMGMSASAQQFQDVQTPRSPLVLKAQGSFFIGGNSVLQTATEVGFGPPGHVAINQMYVEYKIPEEGDRNNPPLVLIHGGTLTGKAYETTPDGRMGWEEYFVRKGHAVYNLDQAGIARSGFNQAVNNDVRAGVDPPTALRSMARVNDELGWVNFRFGPSFGVAYSDGQFPVGAAGEFSKQNNPITSGLLPTPNPNYKELSDLAVMLKGAVLIGHSASGLFPVQAALTNPTGIKALVDIEPVGCQSASYTASQIATLATVPILVVFGDHLDAPPIAINWLNNFNDCKAFVARVNAANGHAKMLHPADLGIHGNSHMMMQDKNNLQIADLILKWIDESEGKRW